MPAACPRPSSKPDLGFVLISVLVFTTALVSTAVGQAVPSVISLVSQPSNAMLTSGLPESEQSLISHMPANAHFFGAVSNAQRSTAEQLTLTFAAASSITKIISPADFKRLPGGTCVEGASFQAGSACTLLVRFAPQGPGHRLGKLLISHSTSADPTAIVLTGFANFPVASISPGVITTVPATFSNGAGLINGARNIALDDGDSLYIADTLNNAIRYIDSSGNMTNLTASAPSVSSPLGVSVAPFGSVFFTEPATNAVFEIEVGGVEQASGSTNNVCTLADPCKFRGQAVVSPGSMSADSVGNIFFVDGVDGAGTFYAQSSFRPYIQLADQFTFQETYPEAFAVDQADNLYTGFVWPTGPCEINRQSFTDAANYEYASYTRVVGGWICGFSGDGGQAAGAEIGAILGQIAFDQVGNMFFADTSNNRIRRVDAQTGIIRTVAGNGTSGYRGDNGPSTIAELAAPLGVAVDSQGQIYILQSSDSKGTAQVVRKVGTGGALIFNKTAQGSSTSTLILTVSNSGNAALTFVRDTLTGTNPSDFVIDNNTTSCNFSAGNSLASGLTCQIGVIFKPSAVGTRTATLTLVDNTVTGSNKIKLSGTGTTAATVKFTSPTAGQKVASGSGLSVAVTVTSKVSPAPTGKVTFSVDGKQAANSATIAGGEASATLIKLSNGTHTLTAAYNGDNVHPAASASETIIIGSSQ